MSKHVQNKICYSKENADVTEPTIQFIVTKDDLNDQILGCIKSDYLRFLACQRLGAFEKCFYPIAFEGDNSNSFQQLEHLLAVGTRAIEIATSMIRLSQGRNFIFLHI